MQRRIVFAALGFPLALIAGVAEYILIILIFSPSVDSWMFPIVVCVCWTIDMLLFPAIGYAWGKRRDRAARVAMPARYGYSNLGLPLALASGGAVTILLAVLTYQSGPYNGSPGPGFVCVLLITPAAMLIFPLIGYLWGKRKDQVP